MGPALALSWARWQCPCMLQSYHGSGQAGVAHNQMDLCGR